MTAGEYQLLCTYLKNAFFISTMWRKSSADDSYFFETIVWEWDSLSKKNGHIVEMADSGTDEDTAIESHFSIVKRFNLNL